MLLVVRESSPSCDDDTLTHQHPRTKPRVQGADVPRHVVDHRERGHQVQERGGGAGVRGRGRARREGGREGGREGRGEEGGREERQL